VGDALNHATAAGNADLAAMQARAQGRLARQQARQEAFDLERSAAAQSAIAADNMMTLRQNGTAAVAAARAEAGASGFGASAGSKARVEQSVAEQFEAAIANLQRSNSISDQNSRYAANVRRSEGEQQMRLAEVAAQYQGRLARMNRRAFLPSLVGGALMQGSMFGLNFVGSGGKGDNSKGGNSGGSGK